MKKIYSFSSWSGTSYRTTTYFYATSLDEAERLLGEIFDTLTKVYVEGKCVVELANKRLAKHKHDEAKGLVDTVKNYNFQLMDKAEINIYAKYQDLQCEIESLAIGDGSINRAKFIKFHLKNVNEINLNELVNISVQDGD